jgi:hypothetical protein
MAVSQSLIPNSGSREGRQMKKISSRLGRLAAALAVTALAAGSALLAGGQASASTTAYTPIRNASPGNLCLDVRSEDGLQNAGARLQIYHCTGVSEQKFFLVPAGSSTTGPFEIRPQSAPSLCLAPSDIDSPVYGLFGVGPNHQGAQVVQQGCLASVNGEAWIFKSTNEIVNQFYPNMCLDTSSSGTHDHELVMLWPCNGNLAQRWLS